MDNHLIISQLLVPRAQQIARETGLVLGQTIAHPSEPITCQLQTIHDDGTVTIGWEEISHRVPANECFDPNDCLKLIRG